MKSYLLSIIFFVFGVAACLFFKNCEPKQTIASSEVKAKIVTEIKANDSIKKDAVKSDSIRTVYVYKYRASKSVPGPCDTVLKYVIQSCDTMAIKDSLVIYNYKLLHKSDSVIINLYKQLASQDSIKIDSLLSQIKKCRRRNKILLFTAIVAGGSAVVR